MLMLLIVMPPTDIPTWFFVAGFVFCVGAVVVLRRPKPHD